MKVAQDAGRLNLSAVALPALKNVLCVGAGILSLSTTSFAKESSDQTPEKSCCSPTKSSNNSKASPNNNNNSGLTASKAVSENNISTANMALIPTRLVKLGGGNIPEQIVKVDAFWISKTETTNDEFAKFVKDTGYITVAERPWEGGAPASMVFSPPASYSSEKADFQWWKVVEGADWKHPEGPGSSLAGKGNLPVVHIAYEDAVAYAKWAGGQLMTEAQFRAAAAEDPTTIPAKRNSPDPAKVNYYQGEFPLKDKATDGYAGIAPVASYPANSYGVHDLLGNGWELTSSIHSQNKAEKYMVIAGGSFLCSWEGKFTCTNATPFGRARQDPNSCSNHVTFRIVKPVEKQ